MFSVRRIYYMKKVIKYFYDLFIAMMYLWSCKLLLNIIFYRVSREELLINILLILLNPYIFAIYIKFTKYYTKKRTKKIIVALIPFIIILSTQIYFMVNLQKKYIGRYNKTYKKLKIQNFWETDTGDAEWNRKIALMYSRPKDEFTYLDHYNRNEFDLEFTYEEIQILQERLPEEYKWDDDVLCNEHQHNTINGKNNNGKYVSYDGYFELIFNDNNVLQTEKNNPEYRGTFNQYSPISEVKGHLKYDW